MKYREIKSRNSVTKDFGGLKQVKVEIPPNTCHPEANVQFRSLEQPPTWNCDQCGTVLLIETPVNTATIIE
jgi:hypothetical protein